MGNNQFNGVNHGDVHQHNQDTLTPEQHKENILNKKSAELDIENEGALKKLIWQDGPLLLILIAMIAYPSLLPEIIQWIANEISESIHARMR